MFESGNERSDLRFYSPESGMKSAYHVRQADSFALNTELMNMEDKEKWAWVTLDFNYIEGFDPEWKEGKIVWISVGPDRCTGSDSNPFGATNLTSSQQPIRDVFEEYSVPWKSPKNGYVLGANSHLHDGGVDTKVYLDELNICTSQASYAKDAPKGMGSANGIANGNGGGHSHSKRQMGGHSDDSEHIAHQSACAFDKPIPLKKGQEMFIKCAYDFRQHSGMKNAKGELDEVMAIAGALVAFDYNDWQSKNLTKRVI